MLSKCDWLEGVNWNDRLGLDLSYQVDDVVIEDVAAGVGFDQVALGFRQSSFHRLPVGSIQVSAPAGVETS